MSAEDLKGLDVAKEVDCEGEVCPGPVLKTMEALNAVSPGDVVVLKTDLEVATTNVKIAVETGGLAQVLGIVEEDGLYLMYMKRAK